MLEEREVKIIKEKLFIEKCYFSEIWLSCLI